MKKFKRLLSTALALLIVLSVSASALAASYDVANWSDMQTAFGDTSGEDVNINLTDDVECAGALNTANGITYTITTANDSTLKDPTFKGSGDVSITADIEGTLSTQSGSSVSVTVDGDITSEKNGITANGDGAVTVTGDVTGGDYGIYANNNSIVTVTGDIDGGIRATGGSIVTVNGDVCGKEADSDSVDFTSPYSCAIGSTGVNASGSSTVTVNGNVTGGAGYGTIGFGGAGVYAEDESTINVSGSVSGGSVYANEATKPYGTNHSYGGDGVKADNSATVTVGGNVTGGSTNADAGHGGRGIHIIYFSENSSAYSAGAITVGGSVSGGKGAINGKDITINNLLNRSYDDYLHPSVTVGSFVTGDIINFDNNSLISFLSEVIVTNPVTTNTDTFWQDVYEQICRASKEDTITVDAGDRTMMPSYIMNALREYEVILVIRWNGGDDIVIEAPCEVNDGTVYFLLADLAETYKN